MVDKTGREIEGHHFESRGSRWRLHLRSLSRARGKRRACRQDVRARKERNTHWLCRLACRRKSCWVNERCAQRTRLKSEIWSAGAWVSLAPYAVISAVWHTHQVPRTSSPGAPCAQGRLEAGRLRVEVHSAVAVAVERRSWHSRTFCCLLALLYSHNHVWSVYTVLHAPVRHGVGIR